MKKMLVAFGLAALCFGAFLAPGGAQTTPSGRSIVWPLENPPSADAVLQPARFTRLAMGAWFMHSLGLTTVGAGVYANCATNPGTGLFVQVAPAATSTLCGIYQVTQDDVTAIPVGVTPQLPADPTLIVIQALQAGGTAPLGPLTPPGTQKVYWMIEAQVLTADTAATPRPFFNPVAGTFANQIVATQRTDAIAYQLVEGTSGSSPTKPTADSGWFPFAYILVPNGTSQITSGMISAGNVFTGFQNGAYPTFSCSGILSCSPNTGPTPGMSVPAPVPSATGCGSVAVSWPNINFNTTGCATNVGNNYDATILGESSATHYWKLADNSIGGSGIGACTSTLIDSITGGATAAPSPVPIALGSASPQCGAPSPIKDSETSAEFDNCTGCSSAQSFAIPATAMAKLCTASGASPTCNQSFSVECIVVPNAPTASSSIIFSADQGGTNTSVYLNNGALSLGNTGAVASNFAIATGVPLDLALVMNQPASSTILYVNGVPALKTTYAAKINVGDNASIGGAGGTSYFNGRILKCSTYNIALTVTQVHTHFAATGFK